MDMNDFIEILKTLPSKCSLLEDNHDEEGTHIIEICGGLNGKCQWGIYFHDLAIITSLLKDIFGGVWLIDIKNDVADDVFYATFGVGR